MPEILADIGRRKRVEVAVAKERVSLEQLVEDVVKTPHQSHFLERLKKSRPAPAVIAEIKVASPTHPALGSLADAAVRAVAYERAGADAISFITEKHYFKSDIKYLAQLKAAVDLPILQKDFVIDEYQVYESRQAGADALLLIARLVEGPLLERLVGACRRAGLEPVVEVNNEADLAKAVVTDTSIVAVNARDVRSFAVDVAAACRLLETVGARYVRLGFSGIQTSEEVRQYRAAGADGVLVGTSLMQAPDIGTFLQGLRG